MLKPSERIALREWWKKTGREVVMGVVVMTLPAFVVLGLLIGFTTN